MVCLASGTSGDPFEQCNMRSSPSQFAALIHTYTPYGTVAQSYAFGSRASTVSAVQSASLAGLLGWHLQRSKPLVQSSAMHGMSSPTVNHSLPLFLLSGSRPRLPQSPTNGSSCPTRRWPALSTVQSAAAAASTSSSKSSTDCLPYRLSLML
jgi:hypothetical protein